MTAPFIVIARLDRAIQRGRHWFLLLWITRSSRVMTSTGGSLSGAVGITPHALRPWLGSLAIVERIEEPLQHHVRLVGTSVASLVGYGLSGSILEDIYAVEVRDAVIRPYVMAHEEAAPVFSRTAFQRRGDTIMQRYERLVLPVAGSCETDPAFFYIWFDVRHFAPDAAGAEVETEVILLPRQSSRSVAAA